MRAFRYLLMVSPTHDMTMSACSASLEHQGFVRLFSNRSVAVFATRALVQPLSGGLAIGHLFDRTDSSAIDSAATFGRIGDAALLFGAAWGAFLGIFWHGASLHVARDPSGTLPCFYTKTDDIMYFAPDARTLVDQGALKPNIDWHGVARALVANDLPERGTALLDVYQLLPGECLTIDATAGVERRMVWNPWDYVNARAPTEDALNSLIKRCVRQWQQEFGPILLTVSGGVDSSIVAASIAAATTPPAITVSTDDAHGDESAFARIVADARGLPLLIGRYRMAAVDIGRSTVSHLPRPGGRAQLQAYDAVLQETAGEIGADAVLTGLGGDNIFYFTRSVRPLIDRLIREGVSARTARTFMDTIRLTGASPWTAARAALAFRHNRGVPYRWRSDRRLLSRESADAAAQAPLVHPWLEAPSGALPGQAAHIAQLIRTQSYVDISDRSAPLAMVHPLLSQPLIEACLSIPSWRFCEGGIDRAFARRAFRNELPPPILERRQKGGPDGFAMAIIREHLPEVRARLMDGELAGHGLIDRAAVERSLDGSALQAGEDYVRLLLMLDTEAWVRHWRC